MTTPTPEAIEAAARALWLTGSSAKPSPWDEVSDGLKGRYRMFATAALTAAAPFIAAKAKTEALREAADVFQGVMIGVNGRDPRTSGAAWLRARAELIERKGS